MVSHNIYGQGGQEEGLAELFHLGQKRSVKLKLTQACSELKDLVKVVRDEANDSDERGNLRQDKCRLDQARQWVKSLANSEINASCSEGVSQPSQDFDRAEDARECEWAASNSFQNYSNNHFTYSQFLKCAAGFQAGLQERDFSGDWSLLGTPHKRDALLDLADRAETALNSLGPDSSESEGGAGNDSDGDGGQGSGGHGGSQSGNGHGGSGRSGEGGGDGGGSSSSGSRRRGPDDNGDGNRGDANPQSKRVRREEDGGHRGTGSSPAGGAGDNSEDSRGGGAASSFSGGQPELSLEQSVWRADEDPEAIPAEARQDELERRMAARRALIEFKNAQAAYAKQQSLSAGGGAGVAAEELVRPTVERQRIWMDGEWKKRVPVHRQEIKGWGTFYLKGQAAVEAKRRQPSTTILDPTDRGDKYVEQGSVYLQRSDFDGEGLFLLSGVRGLPKGSIVGPYAGTFFNTTAQSRHKTGSKEGTHWVTLRIRRAVMPTTVAGIDGAVRPKLVNGRRYNLEYYLRNGLSSLANSRPQTECNCKFVVEYPNYESVGKLYIDDEFCPVHVPMNQRVTCIPPAPHPTRATPHSTATVFADFGRQPLQSSAHCPMNI